MQVIFGRFHRSVFDKYLVGIDCHFECFGFLALFVDIGIPHKTMKKATDTNRLTIYQSWDISLRTTSAWPFGS